MTNATNVGAGNDQGEMTLTTKRRPWRVLAAPLLAIAMFAGYTAYSAVDAQAPAAAKTNVGASDILLAASTAKGIHLEYDTVTGAPSAAHTNHASIASFAWKVANSTQVRPGTGATVGRQTVDAISLTKSTDRFSTALLTKELKGTAVAGAIVYFTDVNVNGVAFDSLEFDLKSPIVTGFSLTSNGDTPNESLSIVFNALTIKAHVAGAPAQTVTYNVVTNTTV